MAMKIRREFIESLGRVSHPGLSNAANAGHNPRRASADALCLREPPRPPFG
jgi:hypothetical protein